MFQPTSAADRAASGAPRLFVGAAKSSLWRHQEKDYSQYLRFYGDEVVIGVSSTGTPAQVIRWLRFDPSGPQLVASPLSTYAKLSERAGPPDRELRIDRAWAVEAVRRMLVDAN